VGAPHVFVADLDHPDLDPDDRHHLERVLRLRPGDAVSAGDGAGGRRACRLAPGGRLEIDGEILREDPPRPALTVGFALTKGSRPELVVQKLTELGIDRIVPFAAARSVARWHGERADRHTARLRRVAREAAMQSRRAHLPEVAATVAFAEAAALPAAALAERGGLAPSLDHPTVLVGPEGGWEDAERAIGLPEVDLGPHVLRAETAAIALAAILSGLRRGTIVARGRSSA
jgi:16S rRNA (uracil1498-N3)-methyltransferase